MTFQSWKEGREKMKKNNTDYKCTGTREAVMKSKSLFFPTDLTTMYLFGSEHLVLEAVSISFMGTSRERHHASITIQHHPLPHQSTLDQSPLSITLTQTHTCTHMHTHAHFVLGTSRLRRKTSLAQSDIIT